MKSFIYRSLLYDSKRAGFPPGILSLFLISMLSWNVLLPAYWFLLFRIAKVICKGT
jgi:hypothetical protein